MNSFDKSIDESVDESENKILYYQSTYLNANDLNTFEHKNEECTNETNDNRKILLPVVKEKLSFWKKIKTFFRIMKKGFCDEVFIEKNVRFIYRTVLAIGEALGKSCDIDETVYDEKTQIDSKKAESLNSNYSLSPDDTKRRKSFIAKLHKKISTNDNKNNNKDNKDNKNKIENFDIDDKPKTAMDFIKNTEQIKPIVKEIKIEQCNQKTNEEVKK